MPLIESLYRDDRRRSRNLYFMGTLLLWQSSSYKLSCVFQGRLLRCLLNPVSPRRMRPQSEKLRKTYNDSGRRGWSTVCSHLERRDYALAKKYDEDISTLLIVAGLFSTVLTAFIVESYQWLQEDYAQTSAQLLAVAVSLLQQPQSNASSPVQMPSSPSGPAPVVVAINVLWFLSLVLSLASVILGIMVKQWMREYHIAEGESPEHALWLRQIRYQALKAWKIPTIVVSLSTLLELALLCFMAGLILLLWSLHLTLAIIVSSVVGVLILIAATATCMPAFLPNCPYKSPTGWCCVLLCDALVRCIYRTLWKLGFIHQSSYLSCLVRHGKMKGWTERDLRNNLGSVLQTRWGGTETTDEDLKVEALKLSHLADAVAWVREKTQNDHMCSDVCSDAELSDLGPNARVYLLAPIYAFCRHIYSDPSRFMREQWYRYLPAHGRHGAFVFLPSGSLDEWNPWQIPRGTRVLDVLSIMLLRRTDTVVGKVISIDADAEGYGTELMHALISALCFLYHAIKIIPTSTLFNEFVGFLVSLHNRLADPREPYDELFPSLRTFCVQVIQHLGSIEFIEHEICVNLRYRSMSFAHCTRAALHVYLRNRAKMSRENWHLFITLADLALTKCSSRNPGTHEVDEMKALLQCMDEALQMVLDSSLRNCGYYDQLPWIETLINSPTTVFKHMPVSLPRNIHKINKYTDLAASRGNLEKLRQRWNIVADKNIYLTSKETPDDTTSITSETRDTDTTVYEEDQVLPTAVSTPSSDVVVSPSVFEVEEGSSSMTNLTSWGSSGYDISVSSATSANDVLDFEERLSGNSGVITASRTGPRRTLTTEVRSTPKGDTTYAKRLHTAASLYLAVPTEDDNHNDIKTL